MTRLQRDRLVATRFDALRSAGFAAMDTQEVREPPRDRAIPGRLLRCAKIKETVWEGAIVINRLLRSAFTGLGLLLVAPLTQAHAQSHAKIITLVVPYA